MRIAIVGGGISGLTAAYLLQRSHDVTLFEANDYLGGHTHTVDVEIGGHKHAVDTGFIVYNDRTYPNFIKLLDRLGVQSQPTSMSFSVRCGECALEYGTGSAAALFAQTRNLVRPAFLRMLREIGRFNREATKLARSGMMDPNVTLGEFLETRRFSRFFADHYILPMGGAIWSCGAEGMRAFPLRFLLEFLDNHGLLALSDQPQWRVLKGGSRSYVEKFESGFQGRTRRNEPVRSIERREEGVRLRTGADEGNFDTVVLATHSDQALEILSDASGAERDILSSLPYQPSDAVLHTDTDLLPRCRRAWASWNCHGEANTEDQVAVTYNMNILQGLDASETACVSLNSTGRIRSSRVLMEFDYSHPVYAANGVRARGKCAEISGVDRTHFCGAYWGHGFHEDGVVSGLRVARAFGEDL